MKKFVLCVFIVLLPLGAFAQAPEQKDPLSFGKGSGPIKIESDALEVRDKDKTAIFSGNVIAVRGDTTVRATSMKAFYDSSLGHAAPSPAPAANNASAPQQVRRIEMTGKVFFSQKDQQGTGDSAVYERASDTLTLIGNVVLTQGKNVAHGQRLIVDMATGHARLEGRPNMLLAPEDKNQKAEGAKQPSKPMNIIK